MLSGTASAHLIQHQDADEANEFGLDIRKTWIEHEDGQNVFNVRTFERFSKADLYGDNGFMVYVDRKGGPRWDFRIQVDLYEDTEPYCNAYDRAGYSRGGAYAEKTPRGLSCPIGRLGADSDGSTRWHLVSTSGRTMDRAPNSGWFEH